MRSGVNAPWKSSPKHLHLQGNAVHVWRAFVTETPQIEAFWGVLSSEERTRADRFHFPDERAHFIAAHGILRQLLAGYLNRDPQALQFATNAYGKPSLHAELDAARWRFNLSHSSSMVLVGITSGREIGVDVERVRELDLDPLLSLVFSESEAREVSALPADARLLAFYRGWTRKEAYAKARGVGLARPRESDEEERSRWSLRELDPGPGYVGALVVETGEDNVEYWDWRTA